MAQPTRLSLSPLWAMQTAFYEQNGVDCWAKCIVPNFVTSNAFIAHSYAAVLLGFVRDALLRADGDPSQPVYALELGTGSGKFSFLLLRKLAELREFFPAGARLVYVMTDFAQSNVNFWRSHPPFQEFIDAGLLDFAVLDAENIGAEVRLQLSGAVISAETTANPLACVANYVVDTLRHDAFRVKDGELQEALCTVESDSRDSRDPLRHVRCNWTYRPCVAEGYYADDAELSAVLAEYAADAAGGDRSFLLPVGGVLALRGLERLSRSRVLLLAGDKAYNAPEEFPSLRDPHIAFHGSFSCMANFHALQRFTEARGGLALTSAHLEGFKVCAFALGAPREALRETRLQFRQHVERFGPEGFSALQRAIKDETPSPKLRQALAVVRLAHHDPDIFFKFKAVIIDSVHTASRAQQQDVLRDLEAVRALYYPLQTSKDVPFELGRLCMALKQYGRALELFEDSQRINGAHHVSWFNKGVCHQYLGSAEAALDCFNKSLECRADYADALAWKATLEARGPPPPPARGVR